MKTKTITTLVFVAVVMVCTSQLNAQISRGVVKEGLKLSSKILGKDVRYTIYLPFDYDTSERFYPVVYLLHGYSDDDTGWLQFGHANLLADEAIANQKIPPMIIVMPDGGVSWYINNNDGSVRYEDFFIKEFMPYIESKYRIRAEKQYRGIAGLSMGGFGALNHALTHPDLFNSCVAFSSGVRTDEEMLALDQSRWDGMEGPVYGAGLKGQARLTDHYKANNPIHIMQTGDVQKIKSVRFYLDCGDDDFLYKGNSTMHILMRDREIPHEYRVREGGHSWGYWRTGLIDGLAFIGQSFHR